MKERDEFLQCCRCGQVHRVTIRCDTDDIYIKAECSKCGYQKHLLCGENLEDIYMYYNNVLDERFYNYNTK